MKIELTDRQQEIINEIIFVHSNYHSDMRRLRDRLEAAGWDFGKYKSIDINLEFYPEWADIPAPQGFTARWFED